MLLNPLKSACEQSITLVHDDLHAAAVRRQRWNDFVSCHLNFAYRSGWVRENYAGMGSVVRHTPVHPAYALFGLPSIVTVPLASP